MKLKYHKDITVKKWKNLHVANRMANIGSEVIHTLQWSSKGPLQANGAFERSIELFDVTLLVEESLYRKREIGKLKLAWIDYAKGSNIFKTTRSIWENEFMSYAILARNPSASSAQVKGE